MSRQRAEEILKQHEKRATEKRVALLKILMDSSKAFTLSGIEKQLTIPIDRVTIYRTLHSYEMMGLVTKMVDHKGTCIYMYNHEAHSNSHVHPHLRCKVCEKVVCLPCLPSEYTNKLVKHEIEEMYFLMEGICSKCLPT